MVSQRLRRGKFLQPSHISQYFQMQSSVGPDGEIRLGNFTKAIYELAILLVKVRVQKKRELCYEKYKTFCSRTSKASDTH